MAGDQLRRRLYSACEQEIDKRRAERRECEFQYVLLQFDRPDMFSRFCNRILKEIVPSPKESEKWIASKDSLAYLRGRINDILQVIFSLFAAETGLVSMELAARSACMTLERFKNLRRLAAKAVEKRKALYDKREAENKLKELSS